MDRRNILTDLIQTRPYKNNVQRVAMRSGSTLKLLPGGHSLVPRDRSGNVSLAMDANDELVAQARYEPDGKLRWNGNTVMPNHVHAIIGIE